MNFFCQVATKIVDKKGTQFAISIVVQIETSLYQSSNSIIKSNRENLSASQVSKRRICKLQATQNGKGGEGKLLAIFTQRTML